ncbi:MAG: hypothetical protein GY871_04680 [Actinomycetales bacterium]|nr:hypothetical protein [Actinomycetales bacterium]
MSTVLFQESLSGRHELDISVARGLGREFVGEIVWIKPGAHKIRLTPITPFDRSVVLELEELEAIVARMKAGPKPE